MSLSTATIFRTPLVGNIPTLNWNAIDWTGATTVRPKAGAFRFVIPMHLADGGQPFDLEQQEAAGKQVGGWTMKQGVGMTFTNPIDRSLQGVQGDGSGVLIVNGTNAEKAARIMRIIGEVGGMHAINSILSYRALIHRIGEEAENPDIYNSDRAWMQKNTVQDPAKLDAALTFQDGDRHFGFLPKTAEISRAYYLTGRVNFQGARGQMHGLIAPVGIIIKNPGSIKMNDAGEVDPEGTHKIPDIYASQIGPFVSDYVLLDGTQLSHANLADQISGLEITVPDDPGDAA